MAPPPLSFYEFFAGGGMARLGLGCAWTCAFANDFDPLKAQAYAGNFGDDHLRRGDVWALEAGDLPGRADLAWASSPCQDLSLAGHRRGLAGQKSSAFWGFWRLIEALDREGRAPRAVVIENVAGLLTSSGGEDFTALATALAKLGYRFGALEADASLWLPQSRSRLFVIAVRDVAPHPGAGSEPFHTRAVRQAFDRLPDALKARWVWWSLPEPRRRNGDLAAILEPDDAVEWMDAAALNRLLGLMGPVHRAKLAAARESGERRVGFVPRRGVRVEKGQRVQRAEVRFDGLAGCLRTPSGGSSRQFVVVVEGKRNASARLLTPRETARR